MSPMRPRPDEVGVRHIYLDTLFRVLPLQTRTSFSDSPFHPGSVQSPSGMYMVAIKAPPVAAALATQPGSVASAKPGPSKSLKAIAGRAGRVLRAHVYVGSSKLLLFDCDG